jgi:circadian clock protein KaiC
MRKQTQNRRTQSNRQPPTMIPKIATHIEGLDEILHGGIPAGRTTLLNGGPGTGKSVLGLEFLYRGAMSGNPGIFLTFEETAQSIRQNALTFGWDLARIEQAGKFFLMEGQLDPHVILSGDFNLKGLLAVIEGKAKEMAADRIVIDAIDMLMRLFDDPKQQQNEIFALNRWLKDQSMTALLTTKNLKDTNSTEYDYLDFMADCVIYLDQRVSQQVTTKRLQVLKYRGSGYSANEYPFLISENGVHFNPITDMEMRYEAGSKRISSGDPSLDTILGGGYLTGTCILIVGATGTGKTSLACTFARSACQKGQKVLYINNEESPKSMAAGMLSMGIDLRPAIKDSTLQIMSVMPESIGIEEQLFTILTTVRRSKPHHVVLDAISACKRIGGEKAAFDLLMRLIDVCKKMGITIILVNQSKSFSEDHEISGIGISSIIDTVITLRLRDEGNEMRRILLVWKSRGNRHSIKYHDFFLTDQGIQIDEGNALK